MVNVIKYDTVICWFVGVHHTAHENHDMIKLGYTKRDFGQYRDLIYNRVIKVISLRLPIGGIISLIERIGILSSDEILEEHEWFENAYMMETYGLKLEKIEQLPIGDMSLMPRIKMVAVKEGAVPINDEKANAAIVCYTIIKFKEELG